MNHFFLLNDAISVDPISIFLEGMESLNAIQKKNDDEFLRHESFFDLPIYETLINQFGQRESAILGFISQMTLIPEYISTIDEFEERNPHFANAFLGVDFAATSIEVERQIIDSESFLCFKNYFYRNKKLKDQVDTTFVLGKLFPNYAFDDQAIKDILYWNGSNTTLYLRVQELLLDIMTNPFQGGIGKTEALKGSEKASKRLTQEHRIVYSLKGNTITIHNCKGHY